MQNQQAQTRKKACPQRATLKPWSEMNRKQRREMQRKIQSEDLSLEVVHPDAAGLDIGNEVHYVAVPSNRSGGEYATLPAQYRSTPGPRARRGHVGRHCPPGFHRDRRERRVGASRFSFLGTCCLAMGGEKQ
jgi:hypothetical protein